MLNRHPTNSVKSASSEEALMFFMGQIYLPKKDKKALSKTLLLARKTLESVRLFALYCNMESEAAIVARRAIVGDV
jgi:hypothetical protein